MTSQPPVPTVVAPECPAACWVDQKAGLLQVGCQGKGEVGRSKFPLRFLTSGKVDGPSTNPSASEETKTSALSTQGLSHLLTPRKRLLHVFDQNEPLLP